MADEWTKVGMLPTWDYTEQKILEGVFISREDDIGPNGSSMYYIEQKGGNKVGVWGNTVLDVRFKNLEIGEEVKIEYLGKVASDKVKGREYHNFEVFHRSMPMAKVASNDVDPDDIPDNLGEENE